jgi:Pilus assembly protein, PilO
MTSNLSPKALVGIVAAVVALVLLVGWFGFVSSKRSTSSDLDAQIADARANLAVVSTTVPPPKAASNAKTAPPAVLATAFPSELLMPSILVQVQRVAADTNVSLEAFAPSGETPLAGYSAIPIDLSVTGQYGEIQRFVHRLRVQAGSTGGKPHASGRLFAVETLGLAPGGTGLPELSATIRIDAFVYSGVMPAETTTTETTTDDSTTASSAAAVETP